MQAGRPGEGRAPGRSAHLADRRAGEASAAHLARRQGSLGARASRRLGGCSRAGWHSRRPAGGTSLPGPTVESFEGHTSRLYVAPERRRLPVADDVEQWCQRLLIQAARACPIRNPNRPALPPVASRACLRSSAPSCRGTIAPFASGVAYVASTKPKKVALIAVARKLVTIMNAMVKQGKPRVSRGVSEPAQR